MSIRNWQLRFEDILEAIDRIHHYTSGLSFDQWQNDIKTIDAVIRNLEIIGEAAKHVPPDIQTLYPDIPWHKMRGIRNVLVHEYFGVDTEVLWRTTQEDLPGLRILLLNAIVKMGPRIPDSF